MQGWAGVEIGKIPIDPYRISIRRPPQGCVGFSGNGDRSKGLYASHKPLSRYRLQLFFQLSKNMQKVKTLIIKGLKPIDKL